MEEEKQHGKFQVVVLDAPDPFAIAQIVAGRIGAPIEQVKNLVAMAPGMVATDMDGLSAEDLVGAIRAAGGEAEKRLIPSSMKCPIHKNQSGRALCKLCDKIICSICFKESKGQPICPECSGEADKIETKFPWVRLILFLILIGVGVYAYLVIIREREPFAWDRPYKLAVVGFMVELPAQWKGFINKFNESKGREYVDLRNHTLPDMVGWFQREYERYGGTMDQALDLTIFGPVDVMKGPPEPPSIEQAFLDRYFHWYVFKGYFKKINSKFEEGEFDPSQFDGIIYVQFVQGGFDGFLESYASRRYNIALANCFLRIDMVETDIMIVLHEFAHLLNAGDHYDPDSLMPLNPEGIVYPFDEPVYPQLYGELMAGRIPKSATDAPQVQALSKLRIGIYTAFEMGWIDESQLRKYLNSETVPPME